MRSLVHIAHVTDLQLADTQSPGRFEFLEFLRGLPGTDSFIPAQRAQEVLAAHAFDAMLSTLGCCESRETGAPVDLVISTGDNIDNAQWNELGWFVTLMSGGALDMARGRPYRGVQSADWPGDLAWHPDGGADCWRIGYGYPTVEGLLDRALAPFETAGSLAPWISCFGNHDGLPFGQALPTPSYLARLLSGAKPYALPPAFDPFEHESELLENPETFLAGPSLPVPADLARRVVGRREFVEAHLGAPGLPAGHGYSATNLHESTTYFTHDPAPLVRVVVLDSANLDGFHRGSIGARQLAWLEGQLLACHSSCFDPAGRPMRGEGDDRLVVLASHHGLGTMTNLRQSHHGLEDDHPRFGAEAVRSLLARFPNVVLWLNGHRHLNEIVVHEWAKAGGPSGHRGACVEVSTCSMADWPSQGRLVEIVTNEGAGTISVLTTMVNHASPLGPGGLGAGRRESGGLDGPAGLASLHRELAANVPMAGTGSSLEGRPADRNCKIVLPEPFRLG